MTRKLNINYLIALFCFIFMTISNILITLNYINYKNNKLVINYLETTSILSNQNNVKHIDYQKEYVGILEIPKIKLKRGFYNFDNKHNNVNENVTLINNSTMPDQDNSLLVLASHSGNSLISYFNKLDELELNDELDIYYLNQKYIYKIINIYEVDKNGKIEISKTNEKQLILTTCSKKDKKKQLIIKSVLKEIKPY